MKKVWEGRYELNGGQPLMFADDPRTVAAKGTSEEELMNVLIDRYGNKAEMYRAVCKHTGYPKKRAKKQE